MYFKINLLFHTLISETISNSDVTMVAATLSTIELDYSNNATFSAVNRIIHILKQRTDFIRVLNKIKKNHEFKGITREYLHNHLNKLITEKKIINKTNRD